MAIKKPKPRPIIWAHTHNRHGDEGLHHMVVNRLLTGIPGPNLLMLAPACGGRVHAFGGSYIDDGPANGRYGRCQSCEKLADKIRNSRKAKEKS